MCKELVSIAFCASSKNLALVFNCGKFHTIAVDRKVCENAKGPCVCFFGTCNYIEKVTSNEPVDMTELPKVRCHPCTMKEDATGDRRHGLALIESPLLDRKGIANASEFANHMATLQTLWGRKTACPYHNDAATHATRAESSNQVKANSTEVGPKSTAGQPVFNPNTPAFTPKDGNDSKSGISSENGLKPHPGILASRWANAPDVPAPRVYTPRSFMTMPTRASSHRPRAQVIFAPNPDSFTGDFANTKDYPTANMTINNATGNNATTKRVSQLASAKDFLVGN